MEDKIKTFKRIMKKSNSTRVIILTNHYQITGDVHECEECNTDCCVNLINATICNIEDAYDGECEIGTRYDWIHVNLEKIVAFSFV